MQIQVDIGFEELLEIVKNLPEAQLLRLKNELGDKPKQHTIAATAISNNLPIATLNRKHFERIDNLTLID